jgi:hypothetical protein
MEDGTYSSFVSVLSIFCAISLLKVDQGIESMASKYAHPASAKACKRRIKARQIPLVIRKREQKAY